jgi:outer membrane protein assembly factor BamE
MIRTLFLISFLSLTACGNLSFPGVYRIDVEQGNVVTQAMVDQLKPGMTTRQVRFILGTPLLRDSFHNNRWDYIYRIRNGTEVRDQTQITVYFADDQLTHFSGSFLPSSADETKPNDGES